MTTLVTALAFLLCAAAGAQECPAGQGLRAATPQPPGRKLESWTAQHQAVSERLKAMPDADIVFVGDSITAHFSDNGRWDKLPGLAGRKALNLGVPGDQTENVLWRLDHMDLPGVKPRQAVLLIGTNNLRTEDAPCDILGGIGAIVQRLHAAWPQAQLVVLGILPRGARMEYALERRQAVNAGLSAGAEAGGYRFVDTTGAFFCGGGNNCGYYQDDLLHLLPEGYERLWAVLQPVLQQAPK